MQICGQAARVHGKTEHGTEKKADYLNLQMAEKHGRN